MTHRVDAIHVAAFTTLGTFDRINQRKMIMINLNQFAPYQRAGRDKRRGVIKKKNLSNQFS
jgi:hypothetical protein